MVQAEKEDTQHIVQYIINQFRKTKNTEKVKLFNENKEELSITAIGDYEKVYLLEVSQQPITIRTEYEVVEGNVKI